jgi:predicted GIY-YIG superfamily endonuclease
MYSVYILENPQSHFYIGHTEDLKKRVADHNRTDSTQGKYTRKNGPWKLVWAEEHPTRSLAMKREKEIKAWKSSAAIRKKLLHH